MFAASVSLTPIAAGVWLDSEPVSIGLGKFLCPETVTPLPIAGSVRLNLDTSCHCHLGYTCRGL